MSITDEELKKCVADLVEIHDEDVEMAFEHTIETFGDMYGQIAGLPDNYFSEDVSLQYISTFEQEVPFNGLELEYVQVCVTIADDFIIVCGDLDPCEYSTDGDEESYTEVVRNMINDIRELADRTRDAFNKKFTTR